MNGTLRFVAAFGAFIGTAVAAAFLLAIVFAIVRLWLEGDGNASWLFKERHTLVGPGSPADFLLVFGSVAASLIVALLVWRLLDKN